MNRWLNIVTLILVAIWLSACGASDDNSRPADGFSDYQVETERVGELITCQVTFTRTPPSSDVAAGIVRKAVEALVQEDGSREILAMAFNASGDALPEEHYGGVLNYKPDDRQILTMNERSGLQTEEGDAETYFLRVEERRTARGITPVREWLDVSIVFRSRPANQEIKSAILNETEELKIRGQDINIYVFVGDKSNKVTWKQIQAANGKYMAVDYDANSGEIKPNWNWE